jgi:hypothetical protein
MILLCSTQDKIQIVTGQSGDIDVHASYVDFEPDEPTLATPGRKNTAITGAATTNVILSPAAGVSRNMKTLHIRNKTVGTTIDVTVQHTDGTTTVELHKESLAPGTTLQYTDGHGFLQL